MWNPLLLCPPPYSQGTRPEQWMWTHWASVCWMQHRWQIMLALTEAGRICVAWGEMVGTMERKLKRQTEAAMMLENTTEEEAFLPSLGIILHSLIKSDVIWKKAQIAVNWQASCGENQQPCSDKILKGDSFQIHGSGSSTEVKRMKVKEVKYSDVIFIMQRKMNVNFLYTLSQKMINFIISRNSKVSVWLQCHTLQH